MHSARQLVLVITGTVSFHHNSANKRHFYARISVITLEVTRSSVYSIYFVITFEHDVI